MEGRVLEFKLESLRARGELSADERDRLMAALKQNPAPAPARRRLLTPLRAFLLGVIAGVALCYVLWWRLA